MVAIAISGKTQAVAAKEIDSHSVWKPSAAASSALTDAATGGRGTQEILLQIMKDDNASLESVEFVTTFSTEGAYLSGMDSSLEENPATEGLTIGTVSYPFRTAAQKTFVILNAAPRIIDVSEQKVVKGINIARSKDYLRLWGATMQAMCIWYEPVEYNVKTGKNETTEFEVIYPVQETATQKLIGYAHVGFGFVGKTHRALPPELEFISVGKN
jgi:hypothetical protein